MKNTGIPVQDYKTVNRDALTEPIHSSKDIPLSPINYNPIFAEYDAIGTGVKHSKYTEGMPFNSDPIEWQAQHQSTGNRLAHGLGRLVTTTGTKFLEGVGFVASLPTAIAKGDIDAMLENSWVTAISDLEETAKESMPIFHSRKYLEGNVWQQAATLGFWMDDAVDGVAFLLSALIGSAGVNLAFKGGKAFSMFGKSFSRAYTAAKAGKGALLGKSSQKLLKLANETKLLSMGLLNSVSESAFEAKDTKNQILEQFAEKIRKGEMSYEEANAIASKAARDTYVSNVFALMPSNYITNSMFFKSFKGTQSNLKKALLAKKANTLDDFVKIKRKDLFAVFGKNAAKNVLSEGFYEENIQLAIQNLSKDIALGDVDSRDRLYELASNWANNFFTDEGQKNIFLGAVIGLIPGGVGGIREHISNKKDLARIVPLLDHGLTRYTDRTQSFFKHKPIRNEDGKITSYSKELELDENGQPIPDYDKVAHEFVKVLKTNAHLLGLFESANSGNDVTFDFIKNEAFTEWALPLLREEGGLAFAKDQVDVFSQQELETLQEESEKNATIIPTEVVEEIQQMADNYKSKLTKLSNVWENVNEVVELMNIDSSTDKVAYNKSLLKLAQYSEASRQIFLEDKRRELDERISQLENGSEANIPAVQENVKKLKKKLDQVDSTIKNSIERLKYLSDEKAQNDAIRETEQKIKEDSEELEQFKKDIIKDQKDKAEGKKEDESTTKPIFVEVGMNYRLKEEKGYKNIQILKLNEDGSYVAQEVDEKGEPIGEEFPLIESQFKDLYSATPTTEDDIPLEEGYYPPFESRVRGLRSIYDALTYMNYAEGEMDDMVFRDEELNRFLSNPKEKAKDIPVQFFIDFDSDHAKSFWSMFSIEINEKIRKGGLTLDEIKEILKINVSKNVDLKGFFRVKELEFNTLLDLIPIGARIVVDGKPYGKGLYYHITEYDNIAIPLEILKQGIEVENAYIRDQKLRTQAGRRYILESLFLGNEIDIKTNGKTEGYPNNQKGAQFSLRDVFKPLKKGQVKLWIARRKGQLWANDNEEKAGRYTPGSIYYITRQTSNGKEYAVKLNKSKLTEEHADILFDAILKRYSYTTSRMRGMHQVWDPTDNRVSGLTVGEVIDLLSYFGEATALDYKDKQGKQPNFGKEHLQDKELYVSKNEHGRLILHFGKDGTIDLHDAENRVENKKAFIDWATKNKPYSVRRGILYQSQYSLNDPLSREFKIGSWENKKNEDGSFNTYATFLTTTPVGTYEEEGVTKQKYAVTTDIVPDADGNIFVGPTLLLKFDNNIIVREKVKIREETPKEEKIKQAEKKAKSVQEKETVTWKDFTNLPVGSVIYIKRGNQDFGSFLIVEEKGSKRFKVQTYIDDIFETEVNGHITGSDIAGKKIIEYKNGIENAELFIEVPEQVVAEKPKVEEKPVAEEIITINPEDIVPMDEDEIAEIEKDIPKEELPDIAPEDLDEFLDDPTHTMINPYNNGVEYEQWNEKKELEWLHNKLGNLHYRVRDGLIQIARSGKTAFGQFKWDLITLSSLAEVGVAYHEAFHRVSLLYLSPVERQEIYKEARIRYKLGKDATDRQIEEKLAEEFRAYVIEKETEPVEKKSWPKRIAAFFSQLWDLFISLVRGQHRLTEVDINHLFDSIQQGKYRWSRPIKENIERVKRTSYFSKTIKNVEFNSINTADEYRRIARGLTNVLVKFSAPDFNSFKEARYDLLRKWLTERPNRLRTDGIEKIHRTTKWGGVELSGAELKAKQDAMVKLHLEVANRTEELAANFGVVKEIVDDMLLQYGFVPVELRRKDEIEQEDHTLDNAFDQHDVQSYEKDSTDSIASSIKLMVASLNESVGVDKLTLTHTFVDPSKTWNILMHDLHDEPSYEAMKIVMEKRQKDEYFYKELLKKLEEGSEHLRTQFFTSVHQYRHQFLNSLYIKNSRTGNIYWSFSDADVDNAARRASSSWAENLRYTSFVVTNKDGGFGINKDKLKEISSDYKDLKDKILNEFKKNGNLPNKEAYKSSLVEILSRIGIIIDVGTINSRLVKEAETDESFVNLVAIEIDYLFGEDGVLWSAAGNVIKNFYGFYSDENVVKKLAKEYVNFHPEEISNSVMGAEGAIYYPYNQNSTVTNIIYLLKNDPEYLDTVSSKLFNTNSYFLKQISSNKEVKKAFGIYTMGGMFQRYSGDRGKKYGNLSRIEDYLNKLHIVIGDDLREGTFVFPTMADRTLYYMFSGVPTLKFRYKLEEDNLSIPTEIIDVLYGYAEDEFERIEQVKKEIEQVKKDIANRENNDKLVKNFHYYEDKKTGERDYERANGLKFHHFPSFNEEGFDFKTQARSRIIKILEKKIEDELERAESYDIISKGEDGKYTNNFIAIKKVQEIATKDYNNSFDLAIRSIIAEYTLNTIIGTIESEKLFTGDPAFYTQDQLGVVFEDMVKRLGVMTSTGTDLRTKVPGLAEEETYNVATLRTQGFKSTIYKSIFGKQFEIEQKDLSRMYPELSEKDINAKADRIVENRLRAFTKVDPTDAAVFISPSMYRYINIKLGEWSDEKDAAFNLLQSDKKLTKEEELAAYKVVMQPLKLVYFGFSFDGKYAIPTYDKMALFTLFKPIVRGLKYDRKNLKNRLTSSQDGFESDTQIGKLLERMEDENNPIHMVKFDSAVKVGGRDSFEYFSKDLKEVNNITNVPVFKQNYRFLKRSQVTFPHDSATTKTGTQPIKVGLLDLNFTEEVYDLPGHEDKVNGHVVAQQVMSAVSTLSRKGRDKVFSMFGIDPEMPSKINVQKLIEVLKKEARRASLSDSVIDALAIVETEYGDEKYIELDALPADREWIYQKVLALIGRHTIDLNLPGNQFIQSPSWGMRHVELKDAGNLDYVQWVNTATDELEIIHWEDGAVKSTEVIVSINLFKHAIPNYRNLTFKEQIKWLKENPEVVGYRIPTQGQNSMSVLKIVGFLPENVGDTIIVPNDYTALTGSDFDIDKIYIMRHNYYAKDGKLHKVEFSKGMDEDSIKARHRAYISSFYYKHLKDFEPGFYRRLKNIKYDIHKLYEEKSDLLAKEGGLIKEYIDKYKQAIQKANESIPDSPEENDALYEASLYDKKIDDLQERYGLVKDRYYEDISDTNKDYQEFLNVLEKYLLENKFIPTQEEFSRWEIYDQNTQEAVENQLVDAYVTVLKSEEHFPHTSSPLGELKGILQGMASDIKKWEGKRQRYTDLEYATPSRQADIKFEYILGKKGIGPFALANVFHSFAQVYDLKYKGEVNAPVLRDDKLVDLSAKRGIDLKYISSWLSALIDAHVDIAKDPYIIALNINASTYNVINFLIQAGVGEKSFLFLSQPILKEYAELYLAERGRVFGRKNINVVKYLTDKYKDYVDKDTKVDLTKLWDKDNLENDIKAFGNNNTDSAYYLRQMEILRIFDQLNIAGTHLFEANQAANIDTKGYGKNFGQLASYLNTLQKVYRDNKFVNFDKIVPYDYESMSVPNISEGVSFLGEQLRNSVLLGREMFSGQTIMATKAFYDAHNIMLSKLGNLFSRDESLINKVDNKIYSYVASKFFTNPQLGLGITPGKAKDLLKGDEGIINTIYEIQAGNGLGAEFKELKDNLLIKDLHYVYTIEDPEFPNFLSLLADRKDKFTKDAYTEAFLELFKHPSPKVKSFGRNLFVFAYLTSGFTPNMRSIYRHIPIEILKELETKEGNIVSYNEFIKSALSTMDSIEKNELFVDMFDDIFENSWFDDALVPYIQSDRQILNKEVVNNGRNLIYATIDNKRLYIGRNADGELLFKPYVTIDWSYKDAHNKIVETKLLMKFYGTYADEKGQIFPVYVTKNKRSYSHSGIFISEMSFPSSIFDRNKEHYVLPEDKIQGLLEKRFKGFHYLDPKTEQFVKDDLLSEKGKLRVEEPVKTSTTESTRIIGELPERSTKIGINISSKSSDKLGQRLSNPNWYTKDLMDVETPYKENASKIKVPHLNMEEALKYDMNLMWELQVKKFRKNPELIDEINERGGLEFIKQSSHIVGVRGSRWEGEGMNSNFIKVLVQSYTTVAKELNKFIGELPEQQTTIERKTRPTPEFDKLPGKSATPTMTYAGIGSRETPNEILAIIADLSAELEIKGYTVNTGDAKGADQIFRVNTKKKNVFVAKDATDQTRIIAKEIHPAPEAIDKMEKSDYVWGLMARNTNQVFGRDLNTPVDFVLFWAEETKDPLRPKGGTGQAVEMARRKGIPTINLANPNWRDQLDMVLEGKKQTEYDNPYNPTNVPEETRIKYVQYVNDNLGEFSIEKGGETSFTKQMSEALDNAKIVTNVIPPYTIKTKYGNFVIDFKSGGLSNLPVEYQKLSDIKLFIGLAKIIEGKQPTETATQGDLFKKVEDGTLITKENVYSMIDIDEYKSIINYKGKLWIVKYAQPIFEKEERDYLSEAESGEEGMTEAENAFYREKIETQKDINKPTINFDLISIENGNEILNNITDISLINNKATIVSIKPKIEPLHKEKQYTNLFKTIYSSVEEVEKALVKMPGFGKTRNKGHDKKGPLRVWVKSELTWPNNEPSGQDNFGKASVSIAKINFYNPGLVTLEKHKEASRRASRNVYYAEVNEEVLAEIRDGKLRESNEDIADPNLKRLTPSERMEDTTKTREFINDAANPNISVSKLLSKYKSDITDPTLLAIIDGLINKIKAEHKIKSVVEYDEGDGYSEGLGGGLMSVHKPTDTSWGTIYINGDEAGGGNFSYDHILRTFMHEIVHLYTVSAIYDPLTADDLTFKKEVETLYELAKRKTSNPNLYGYTKSTEFVSELLTNNEFVDDVVKQKYNIFKRIWNAILNAIGIAPSLRDQVREYFLDFVKNKAVFRRINDTTIQVNPSHMSIGKKKRERKARIIEEIPELEEAVENINSFEEVLKRSIEILEQRRSRQVGSKYVKDLTVDEMQRFVRKLKRELDEKKFTRVAIQFVTQAHKSLNKAWADYMAQLEREKAGEPNLLTNLNYLSKLRYVAEAYSVVQKYKDMFYESEGLYFSYKNVPADWKQKKPGQYRSMHDHFKVILEDASDKIGLLKEVHSSRGEDILIDKLAPYYHGVEAIEKENLEREWNELPKSEQSKISLKDYQNRGINLDRASIDKRTRDILRTELKKATRDVNYLYRWLDNMLDTRDPALAAIVKKFYFADEQSRMDAIKTADKIEKALLELEAAYPKGFLPNMKEYFSWMIEQVDGKYTQYRIGPWLSEFHKEWREIYEDTKDLDQESGLYIGRMYVKMTLREKLRFLWKEQNAPMRKDDFSNAKYEFIKSLVDEGIMTSDESTIYRVQEGSFRSFGDLKSLNDYLLNSKLVNPQALDEIADWIYHNAWNFRDPVQAGRSLKVNKEKGVLEEKQPGEWKNWSNPQWQELLLMAGVPKDLSLHEQMEELRKNVNNDPRITFYNLIDELSLEADAELPFEFKIGYRLPSIEKELGEHVAEGDDLKAYVKRAIQRQFTVRPDEEERGNKELTDDSGRPVYFLPIHFTSASSVDPEDQSYDIATLYYKYWEMAHDYGLKQEILPEMELTKFFTETRSVIVRDSKGKPKVKKTKDDTITGFVTKPGESSNIAQMFNDWMVAVVYGKRTKDEGSIKIGSLELDVAKMADFINKYTALNLLGLNYVQGTANVILGETLQAIEAFAGYYTNTKSFTKANRVYFQNMPGIMGDIGRRRPENLISRLLEHFDVLNDYGDVNFRKDTRFKNLMTSNTLFFTSHAGEHYMQTRFMLSMLNDVIAYDKDGKVLGTMLDLYTMKDGKLTLPDNVDLKKSKWEQENILAFSMRLKGILSRLHGEYSDLGRVAVQRSALGRMGYMFRKFVIPGFKRRWQRRQYNERMVDIVEGNYRSTGNFVKNMGRDLVTFQFHLISEDWSKLTKAEKANIHRTLLELNFLIASIILTSVALSLRGEADDEGEKRLWSFWAYQMMRFRAELLFFTPKLDESISILRSPMATMSLLENMIKLSGQIFKPFDIYDRGPWKGEPKIKRTLINMTPGYKQLYRMRDIGSQFAWFN